MAVDVPDAGTVALDVLGAATRELALEHSEMPQAVRDSARDFRDAVTDTLATAGQLDADTAELRSKRDLLPAQGFQRLQREAVAEAHERYADADQRAQRALDEIRAALTDAAIPTLDPARETLAREELTMLAGTAEGPKLAERLVMLAFSGNREIVAVLLRTSFGRALLETRGVTGRDYDETVDGLRSVAAATAVQHGTTARELTAGAALERLAKLGAARGAAGSRLLESIQAAGG
jgi:histone H3/H4